MRAISEQVRFALHSQKRAYRRCAHWPWLSSYVRRAAVLRKLLEIRIAESWCTSANARFVTQLPKANRTALDLTSSASRTGRPVPPNYRYSPEFLTMATWTWSPDGIASFIARPALTIPGNRMSVFQGVADKDMDDLLAFIAAQK